ncbi:MAG: cytidylate kinase-like family protein [Frisingicoccus sp.]|uniref:cytidylate kinase-like family protein n=1 Tax=Frisingicoccus sp. TaxID=1918627 RepID=UPI0025B7D726|nr:cytidylate kinase-like family protein [Frisingicoccus sp.]MDD6232112.1 cytidylate kinase-like family protein [Frisingicoccus sp.]MDY4834035.1 cytidylate kinase-like family protein [Frisingicoccus sp.]
MGHTVITIARQYGSGGKTIGKMLAEDLGIHFYNREILRMASDESGINEQLFGQVDERIKTNLLYRIAKRIRNEEVLPPDSDDFLSTNNLFNYQAKVIRQLADEESCVIIGRCADYVLQDYDNVVSVFIHGPYDFCLEQAMKVNAKSESEMRKYMEKRDKYRGEYYKYYTGKDWFDARNYHLCLDSSKLGFDGCVEAIKAYMKVRGLSV